MEATEDSTTASRAKRVGQHGVFGREAREGGCGPTGRPRSWRSARGWNRLLAVVPAPAAEPASGFVRMVAGEKLRSALALPDSCGNCAALGDLRLRLGLDDPGGGGRDVEVAAAAGWRVA